MLNTLLQEVKFKKKKGKKINHFFFLMKFHPVFGEPIALSYQIFKSGSSKKYFLALCSEESKWAIFISSKYMIEFMSCIINHTAVEDVSV